jgi:SAM-dependent methyltransferase
MEGIDTAAELRRQGLQPRSWNETLAAIKASVSPADFDRFSRAHKNFVGYRSESTLERFYATVFSLGAQHAINGFRFGRLSGVLEDVLAEVAPGQSVLDVGAGGGYVAAAVLRHRAPRAYVVQDPVGRVRDELAAEGLTVLPHPPPPVPETGFDLILCVDSLGEVNADDDGLLSKAGAVPAEDLPGMMEQRYGFAQKLAPWKAYLAPGGRALVWEPFAYPEAFAAVASLLSGCGWDARVRARVPERNYLEIRPREA